MTREELITALQAMPEGAEVRTGMYMGDGQWVTAQIVHVLVGCAEGEESMTVLLHIQTPEPLASVIGDFLDDFTKAPNTEALPEQV